MKVAISATEGNLEALVDQRFGRASWLLLIETNTGELLEAIDNTTGKEAAHGAGISAAAQVADKGAQAVLTGRVGPKAMPILEKANVQVIDNVSGSVRDAIAGFSNANQAGSVTNTSQNNVSQQQNNCGGGRGMGQGQGRGQGQQGQGQGQGQGQQGQRQGQGQGQGQGRGRGMGQGRGQCRR